MRTWHELVAAVGDWVPGGVPALGLILLVATGLTALLWYWFPEWVHGLVRAGRALGRGLAGLRWVRRRRSSVPVESAGEPDPVELPPDELPDLPAAALILSADELAAQGRFKEAVRERLRAIVRDLVERGVIEHRPGWTVTELAGIAGLARPATAAPLAAACDTFSQIWYGQRPAVAADDAAMQRFAAQVQAGLAGVPVPA